ncbi:HNH endonuclease, partial [Pseudomonas aeruginosa]|nr:HNH endonuclease [Pseudomonas aeruginosa]
RRIDQGTVAVRQTGSFTIQTATTAIQSISHCKIIQKADGYAFFSHPTDSTPQKEAARAGSRFA